ncbi:MAG: ABC transporter permease [Anaerovoracaceae bacterium]|nr:ABC transporter permease [Anaerovoracaceae bacterium]
MEYLSDIFNIGLFQNTLRTATPVVLAAMGGLMTEHAGIMNIGMDGMILIGAFVAVAFSFTMSSAAMGVLAAVLCGILIGLFFALFVVKLKSDEFIIGMALNTFAGGLTVYLLRSIFGVQGTFSDGGIQPLPSVHLDFLDSIPVIGPLLNDNSIFIYITWLIVFLAWVFLYRTPYGFWMRAAGEHPQSLATAGIDPQKMKFTASILCGILCGFAGAHLSLGYLTMFTEGMSGSRGFIAFACVIFGMANPPKVFLAALLFGFLDALGLRLQGAGIPSDLTSTIPYLTTVLMLVYVVVTGNRKKKKRAARQVDMSVSLNKI